MKLALASLASLASLALGLAACSIHHQSDQFTCTAQSQCDSLSGPHRLCTDGYCVVPGGQIDAPIRLDASLIDAPSNTCPAQCTSCDLGTHSCKIDCALTQCTNQVVCPTGWNCNVQCSTSNSCRNGVNCLQAKTCTIGCSGASSCRNLACGMGRCDIQCTGSGSCRDVACGLSCGCGITCAAGASCSNVACKQVNPGTCDSLDGGCLLALPAPAACNTCP